MRGTVRLGGVRRSRFAVTAVMVSAALVLSACGSDSGDEDDLANIGEGSASDEVSEDTEPDEDEGLEEDAAADGIERPVIDLGDFENVYDEDDLTGDETVDQILHDSQGFMDAVDEGIVHGETDRPAMTFYTASEALDASVTLVSQAIDENVTQTGSARIFNRTVEIYEGGEAAAVVFCRDYNDVVDLNSVTGEEIVYDGGESLPSEYVTRVELDEGGVWRTVNYHFYRDAAENCG